MLRSFTMNRGPAAGAGMTDGPLALDAVRILVFVVVLITVPLAQPHLGSGAGGIGVAVALGVSTVSWVVYLLARRRPRAAIVALAVTGVAGGVLAGLSPLSTAIAVGCVVTSTAGARLNPETSLAITAGRWRRSWPPRWRPERRPRRCWATRSRSSGRGRSA